MKNPSNNQKSVNQKSADRRQFITSVLLGGAGSLLVGNSGVGNSVFAASDSEVTDMCAELTAADPLYIYTSLVSKLQPTAIAEGRKFEAAIQASQAQKLEELGVLTEKLKRLLPKKATAQSALDRVKTLAYIGKTNVQTLGAIDVSRTRANLRAHAQSQNLIVGELSNASVTLAADVRLSSEAWNLLQLLIEKIDEIRKFQPEVNKARDDFNKVIQNINSQISSIQTALMEASSSVVKGDKVSASRLVNEAITIVKQLPGYDRNWKPNPNKVVTKNEAEELTPNKFVAMLDPGVLQLIEQNKPATTGSIRRSRRQPETHVMTPVTYVSNLNESSNPLPAPQTVKAIVQLCLNSGTWWQVVAVAAVCLPLWSYPRGEQRKSLIYSALTAIPRGPKSDLWAAAHYLDQLRP